jgi:hypothetical protein
VPSGRRDVLIRNTESRLDNEQILQKKKKPIAYPVRLENSVIGVEIASRSSGSTWPKNTAVAIHAARNDGQRIAAMFCARRVQRRQARGASSGRP